MAGSQPAVFLGHLSHRVNVKAPNLSLYDNFHLGSKINSFPWWKSIKSKSNFVFGFPRSFFILHPNWILSWAILKYDLRSWKSQTRCLRSPSPPPTSSFLLKTKRACALNFKRGLVVNGLATSLVSNLINFLYTQKWWKLCLGFETLTQQLAL